MESRKMPNQKLEQKHSGAKPCSLNKTNAGEIGQTEISTGMLTFYLRQLNPYSCSVASVAIVLNTILARLNNFQVINPIDQEQLLSKVHTANWRERVSLAGFHNKHGLSIMQLGMVVESALKAFKIPYKKVNTTPVHGKLKNLEKEKASLFSQLMKLSTDQNHYMIAHFTQGVYTGDWFGGHISPVGSFDPDTRRALILDVDELTEAPYWVPFDIFSKVLWEKPKQLAPRKALM